MMKKFIKRHFYLLMACSALVMVACEENESSKAPSAQFSVSESSILVEGDTVFFVNESTDAYSYLWSFGDGKTKIGKDPYYVYSQSGEYEVTLEASGGGARDLYSTKIMIADNPVVYELYFIDNDAGKLRMFDISDPETIVDVFDLPGFCMGLSFDAENEIFYFSDDDNLQVLSNNLSGNDEQVIASDFSGPRAIALDISDSYIYVSDKSADAIIRVDLLDQSKSTYYSSADDANFLLPVGLDLYDGNLYATAVDVGAETVWKGSLDVISLSNIIDYDGGGYGYGLKIDPINEKIYFDDNDSGNLLMADLDGSNVATVGTSADRVYGIVINNGANQVYWVDRNGVVSMANLDGSDAKILVDLAVDVRGMVLRIVE